jgi:hypothetical protein
MANGNICSIAWHVGSERQGICMLSGDVFAASYHSGDTFGLLIYRLRPDGSLSWMWTISATGATGTETLIPMRTRLPQLRHPFGASANDHFLQSTMRRCQTAALQGQPSEAHRTSRLAFG